MFSFLILTPFVIIMAINYITVPIFTEYIYRFSPLSQQAEFHLAFVPVIHLLTDIYYDHL